MLNSTGNKQKEQVTNQHKPTGEIDLIRLPELSQLTTLKPSTIFKAMKNKQMPQPIKLLGKINAWDKNEILQWLESMRSTK